MNRSFLGDSEENLKAPNLCKSRTVKGSSPNVGDGGDHNWMKELTDQSCVQQTLPETQRKGGEERRVGRGQAGQGKKFRKQNQQDLVAPPQGWR